MTSVDAPASDQQGPPGDHHEHTGGSSHVQRQIIPQRPLPGAHTITLSDAKPPAADQNECRSTAAGFPEREAREWAYSRKGYWRISNSPVLARALPNAYWADIGLKGFYQPYRGFREC
jgi:hypothetical protein